ICFFFFSSRRRHTRFSRDWSSDVCSSDLSAEGYRVRTAATATEGMEQVAAGPLDAVLLDLMLPDRNGLEVLEEIRRFDEDLPVEIGRASCRERVWSSVAAGQ